MNNNIFYRRYNSYYRYPYGRHFYFASPFNMNYYGYNGYNANNNFDDIDSSKETNSDEKEPESKIEEKLPGQDSEKEENNNRKFSLGPIEIRNDRISAFGHSFAIDDLIIVALIVFLFFESNCDYTLLIILGLMLFDISFSSIGFLH